MTNASRGNTVENEKMVV